MGKDELTDEELDLLDKEQEDAYYANFKQNLK